MKNAITLSSMALFVAAITVAANADDSARRTIELRGVVPVVCNATYSPSVVYQEDGTIALGNIGEFCNAGSGYRVVADYTAGGDPGTLVIDGRSVALSAAGSTVIDQHNGPAILSQQLSYRPGSTPIASVQIRLEAMAI